MSYARLDRCDGPECPACGCRDTERLFAKSRWGRQSAEQLRCRNCGRRWWPAGRWEGSSQKGDREQGTGNREEGNGNGGGGVVFHVMLCPECGSDQTKITSTRRPLRHHKCKACGAAFKSVES